MSKPDRSMKRDLFLISLLTLFLELACIRWFPSHVLFLTFFTNTVLLACILGIAVGCLAARRAANLLAWTPLMLIVGMGSAHLVELQRRALNSIIDVGNQASPQVVFFGVEYQSSDLSTFVVPIEWLCGYFFLVIALTMVGPGQQLGRALARLPNRLEAYTIDILGSIVGIVLFAACSFLQLSPAWWFALVLAGFAYFLYPLTAGAAARWPRRRLVVGLAVAPSFIGEPEMWSPYYRVNYRPEQGLIDVNLIGHQQMQPLNARFPAYALPHLLNRDAGGKPFSDVLIIGAGSGNDVSRALVWGAEHIDAVEIDPVIQRIGKQDHPDHPYDDPRVTVHLNDGRNFLKRTAKQYDLIIYALVDSLVLHSSYSNIRLESFLFTKQAMDDVQRRLKPGGVFVMYNYFRQGWIVSRLQNSVRAAFGARRTGAEPPEPRHPRAGRKPRRRLHHVDCGREPQIRDAFARDTAYWIPATRRSPGTRPTASRRFRRNARPRMRWQQFRLTRVNAAGEPLRSAIATDDWPLLYLREPTIPTVSLRGAAIMAAIAALLLAPFLKRAAGTRGDGAAVLVQMFFLGAGFMLVETKAVVHMALLFGSTWIVNSVVFFAVLVMIVLANWFVAAARPSRLAPYYAGLLISLTISALVPMESFLGMDRAGQIVAASMLAFTPILFAGVVFAVSFSRIIEPDRAFGINIAGAMFGGLAEYSSMILGFQYLLFVAVGLYLLSMLGYQKAVTGTPAAHIGQDAAG